MEAAGSYLYVPIQTIYHESISTTAQTIKTELEDAVYLPYECNQYHLIFKHCQTQYILSIFLANAFAYVCVRVKIKYKEFISFIYIENARFNTLQRGKHKIS